MTKRFVFVSIFSLIVVGIVAVSAPMVSAFPPFKDAFKAKYVKPDSTAASDAALSAAFDKAKCDVCHDGPNKKMRNAYGKELAKLLKPSDKGNKAKIAAALEKVESIKSKSGDTYGEKIAGGKLPAQE